MGSNKNIEKNNVQIRKKTQYCARDPIHLAGRRPPHQLMTVEQKNHQPLKPRRSTPEGNRQQKEAAPLMVESKCNLCAAR
jgi:hypothetical protein